MPLTLAADRCNNLVAVNYTKIHKVGRGTGGDKRSSPGDQKRSSTFAGGYYRGKTSDGRFITRTSCESWRPSIIYTDANSWPLGAWLHPAGMASDSGSERFVGETSRVFRRPSIFRKVARIVQSCCSCNRGGECYV